MASNKSSESSSHSSDDDSASSPSSSERRNPVSSEIHVPKPVVNQQDAEGNDRSRSISSERAREKRRKRNSDKSESESSDQGIDRSSKFRTDPKSDKQRRKNRSSLEDKDTEASNSDLRKKKMNSSENMAKQMLTTRTGGAYIPPAKLKLMQEQITDKASEQFQRLAWEALKKSINGLINKVNSPNIGIIVRELFAENIVRGRGLLCLSIMQAQTASPTFTHVYAALGAIINSKFPNIGELLLKRLIINFKRGYKRNDKTRCVSSTRFIAHFVNQQVAHEVLALEILTLLLESPTDDSVEIAISFLKECGQKLTEVSPRGINAIFERLRHVLHESKLDKRTQYMIEVMFQVRKDGFKDNVAVPEELDVVEEEDQFTHMVTLDDATAGEEVLNVFKHDASYEENEEKYQAIKKELLGEDSSDENDSSGDSDSSESEKDDKDEDTSAPIIDQTETNMIALRRTIYLTIQSSLDFEETVHKLMKLNLKPGHEPELCHMIVDCCAQQRTYEKFFGLTAQRLCMVKREYVEPFQKIFEDCYSTVHRLELGKLRNTARMFAHLYFTDAISWEAMSCIHLNEHETTSSSRIFIKILFQELSEYMGLAKLNDRIRDATLQTAFDGLFPRDDPANTRFSINFFTNIGLGGLTEDLRNHLKSNPKPIARVAPIIQNDPKDDSSSSSSSSDSSSSSSSEESEDEKERKRRRKERKKKKKQKKKKKRKTKKHHSEDSDTSNEKSENNDYMNIMMEKMRKQKESSDLKRQESRIRKNEIESDDNRKRRDNRNQSRNRSRSPKHMSHFEDERSSKSQSYQRNKQKESKDRNESRNRGRDSRYSNENSYHRDERSRGNDRRSNNDHEKDSPRNSREHADQKRDRNHQNTHRERSTRTSSQGRSDRRRYRSESRSPDSNRHRSRSRSYSSRRREAKRSRRDSSSSSNYDKTKDREKKRNETRWGEKEKKWRDPLLPKSNTVYKDKLSGMLELLKQDADIKRQKELAENPEKSKSSERNKMDKATMREPSENRPGDWKCSDKECGNINFAWRKECNNCDAEKPENAPDYKTKIKHEHAEWFVGAVKTEHDKSEKVEHNLSKYNQRSKRDSTSSDESARYQREDKHERKTERHRSDRYDRSNSRERKREKHSHREERRKYIRERT